MLRCEKVYRPVIIFLYSALLLACAAGKGQYKDGMELAREGNYQEAIHYLEEAVAAEPENEEYIQTLRDLKDSRVLELISEADQVVKTSIPLTISAIIEAKAIIAKAEETSPGHPRITAYQKRLKHTEAELNGTAKKIYWQAIASDKEEKWLKAREEFQHLQQIFPGYEDSIELMNRSARKGTQSLYDRGKALFDKQEYAESKTYFRNALVLTPRHQPSRELLVIAEKRDTKEYFIDQGEKHIRGQRWIRAENAYRRALSYEPDNIELKQTLATVNLKAANNYMNETRNHLNAGWLSKAFESYAQSLKYVSKSKNHELKTGLIKIGNDLAAQTGIRAAKFQEEGNYGSAWFWFEKIKQIEPEYPYIYQIVESIKDEITRRVKKTIAILDFDSPTNTPDAGMIFAYSLGSYLFKSADKDIKIFERENLPLFGDEKLGPQMHDRLSPDDSEEIKKGHDIDIVVTGSVLTYSIDDNNYSHVKTVTYQVKKAEENIEYLNWRTRNPNPTSQQLEQAPPPYIHKLVDVEKEYSVLSHKKVAFVTVSFRALDTNTSESILVDTIRRSKTVTDTTSAGVPVAGIPYDPLEIPTDTELLQELSSEVVAEVGKEILKPLLKLEQAYFDKGNKHLKAKKRIAAAESFSNAVFNTRLKQIKDSPIAAAALKSLEEVFKAYRFEPDE